MARMIEPVMLLFILACCFIMIPFRLPRPLENEFAEFVKRYNKPYRNNTNEYQRRYEIFDRALNKIKEMNNQRKSEDSALYGATEFTDMTEYEFLYEKLNREMAKLDAAEAKYSVVKPPVYERRRATIEFGSLPKQVDWRAKGLISGVRNQGACGACWAYSVVETIETMYAIRWNRTAVIDLSVQQMIDCGSNGVLGCNGGDTCVLLDWLQTKNIGVWRAEEYPTADEQGTCAVLSNSVNSGRPTVVGFTCENLMERETKILNYLARSGPVVVAVNALQWQNYVGGVIQFHCDGDIRNLNHAVQLVGYVLDSPEPYYIARNSWGVRFGDNGYVKIAIGRNVCGVANKVSCIKVV